MTREELREYARKQPFQPFRVALTTGDVYDIRHPDLIMVGQRSAVIGLTNDPAGTFYSRSFIVDLIHVVGIQELPVTPIRFQWAGEIWLTTSPWKVFKNALRCAHPYPGPVAQPKMQRIIRCAASRATKNATHYSLQLHS
jgi:hypothetical protein